MAKPLSERYVRMYGPLLDILRDIGGEANVPVLYRMVADKVVTNAKERSQEDNAGRNLPEYEVAWALTFLRHVGLVQNPVRRSWSLTSEGWKTSLTLAQARIIQQSVNRKVRDARKKKAIEEEPNVEEGTKSSGDLDVSEETRNPTLISVLRNLPAKGFERLCQRLLREAGFAEVEVTGRSGDGGIDGHGVLQVNELVSFRVMFQCKRYQGSVGSGEVRNFRGAMSGRTDKGIFLTTGYFISEA